MQSRGAEGLGVRCGRRTACREHAALAAGGRAQHFECAGGGRGGRWTRGLKPAEAVGRAGYARARPTSAGRFSSWVTSRSSTIATIRIRRRCEAMVDALAGDDGQAAHRGCGRDAGTRTGGRRDAPSPRASTSPRRRLMCWLACADWRKPWSKARGRRELRAEFVATPEEAGEWLARETRDGDVVLLKASRGVKLEKALEKWQSQESSS